MALPAYGEDLAFIHDHGFGVFARHAAPGVLQMFMQAAITRGLVVDLGCGSGIWAQILTDAGFKVLGVDISKDMNKLAKKRAPKAQFKHGSFLQTEIPSCIAVTALGECLCYRFDPANEQRTLKQFFRRLWYALQPGGLFIFDLLQPGHLTASGTDKTCMENEEWTVFTEKVENKDELARRIVTFRKIGHLYRRGEEIHRVRLYESATIAKGLREIGYLVRIRKGYGSLRFPGTQVAFVARKPSR